MKISPSPCPWQPAILALAGAILLGAAPGITLAEPVHESAPMYAGLLAGSAWSDNEIEDPEGFAHWGMPGHTLDYPDSGLVYGVLAGRRLAIAGVPLRLEIDAMIGDMTARSNRLDPIGLDETVEVEYRWLASARVGIERAMGPVWVFATTGVALSGIDRSVTDIDSGRDIDPYVDTDDSFSDHTTEVGWVAGAGIETRWSKPWDIRLEGLYMDFGQSTHHVNHSGNNRCGPDGPQRPCPYKIDNELGMVRLGITYRFGGW